MFTRNKAPRRLILAVISALLGIVILALVALPFWVQSFLQKRSDNYFGRDFSIQKLDISWHWSVPRVKAQGVTLANLPGADEKNMVSIEEIDFHIRIWKLLLGRVELPDLYLKSPRVVLEKTADGKANWDFPAFSEGATASDMALPDDRHDFPDIEMLKIENGVLVYRDAMKGFSIDAKLASVTGKGGDEGQSMKLTGNGTYQKQAFKMEATGSGLDILRDTSRPYPLDLKLAMGSTNLHVNGQFTDPVRLKGIDAKLDVSGSNMADLFYITGIPLPQTPPYKLSGMLSRQTDEWAYNDFQGTVGDSDLAGNLTYDTSGERGFLKAKLASRKVDIDDLGGFIGMAPSVGPGETAAPAQVRQAREERQSPRLLPDTPVNLKRLRAADMNVALKIDKLMAPHLPFRGMDVVFNLKEGLLTIDPMNLSLADGIAEGRLQLDGRQDIPAFSTNVDLKRLKLSRFFEGSRFESETQGTFGGHLDLKGKGLSLAEIMAGSNGKTIFLMEGGRVSLLLIEAADIDLAEAAPLLLGDDKSTQIRCAVGDFTVNNGILDSNIFILDTTDTKLKGDVAINLKNETINAIFDAHPKDESPLALQSPVVISGRLKDPSVMLEPVETGLRATGAVILGTLLTPIAAIIPFLEVGDEENSNCRALIAAAQNNAESSAGSR
jgi:uncharacterized protein involved in outer membrane biogenesis